MRHIFIFLTSLFILSISTNLQAQNNIQVTPDSIKFKEGNDVKAYIRWDGTDMRIENDEAGDSDIVMDAENDIFLLSDDRIRMVIEKDGDIGVGGVPFFIAEHQLEVQGDGMYRFNSDGSNPTLELVETQDNDYARLFFTNNSFANTNKWSLAGRIGSTSSPIFGLFYNGSPSWVYNEDADGMGIGTTAPSSKLDIEFNSGTNPHLELTETGANDFSRLRMKNNVANGYWDIAGRVGTGTPRMNFFFNDGTSGTNIMSLDGEEQNVNIGTTTNTFAKLYVYNDGEDANSNRNYAVYALSDQSSTAPRHGIWARAIGEGDGSGEGTKTGVTGLANISENTKIGVRAEAGGGKGVNFGLYALANNSGTTVNYAIYGEANGNLSTSTPPVWAGYFAGDVFASGNYLPSDKKLKSGIKTAPSSLDRLKQLDIKTYQYDEKWRKEITLDERIQTGFIAQNVANLFPELVKEVAHPLTSPAEQEEGKLEEFLKFTGVNYVGFIPHLTNAIQEQQAQIEDLQASNKELKATNEALMDRLTRIEALLADESIENRTERALLSDVELKQNAPNPFSENTMISYFIPEKVRNASLQITDINGKVLKSIIINARGTGQIELQANALSAGNYNYSLIVDGKIQATKQMVLTK